MAFTKRFQVRIRQWNEWIARHAVRAMSSMATVYIFLLWCLLPSVNKNWEQFIFYVSGGIIQLVALPLIMVGQRLEGKEAERRLEEDHRMMKKILAELDDIKDRLDNRPS